MIGHVIQSFKRSILSVAILAAVSAGAPPSEFDQVISNPRAYHHREVSLIGMADVGGDRFILYHPPKATVASDFSREIYLALQIEGPNYDRFNHKWVEVSGIIDADGHGLADYACELIVHRVRLSALNR
jgi:hypothetical protein